MMIKYLVWLFFRFSSHLSTDTSNRKVLLVTICHNALSNLRQKLASELIKSVADESIYMSRLFEEKNRVII